MQITSKTSRMIWFILYWVAFWTVVATVSMLVHNLVFYQALWRQTVIQGMIFGGAAGIAGGLVRVMTNQEGKGWANDMVCWGMAFVVGGAIISLVEGTIVPALILAGIGTVGGVVGGLVYPRFDTFRTLHKALAIVFVFASFVVMAVVTPVYSLVL